MGWEAKRGAWVVGVALVTPTDSFSHSMLHQTLPLSFPFNRSSSISPPSSSPPPPPVTATLLPSASSQLGNEARMDCMQPEALKNSFQPEFFTSVLHGQQQNQTFSEEGWVLERGGLVGEDFSVDELLNLGGIVEEFEPHQRVEEEEEEGQHEQKQPPAQQRLQQLQQKQRLDEEEETGSSGLSSEAVPAAEPLVPGGGIADLEWLSQFVDDSFAEFPCSAISPPYHPTPKADTSGVHNPSFGSSSGRKRTWSCCFSLDNLVVPAKARSKRSRNGGRVWSLFRPHLVEPTTSSAASSSASSSACSSSSGLIYEGPGGGNTDLPLYYVTGKQPPFESQLLQKPKKKKGRKPKAAAAAALDDGGSQGQRRCSHCGVQKTPQWRTGPLGAKTLCNACGVRYKSGRLLPEYRPASSPTFVSHVHSNCHRKVLEMRRKKEVADTPGPTTFPPPHFPSGALPLLHAIY